jgi:hypothetical protein
MKDAHLTLRLPEDLARELGRAAEKRGVPKSMVVREAVAQYLGLSPHGTPPRPLSGRELALLWARMPHLTPEEAEAFEKDIELGRQFLLPPDDPWA